MKYTVRVSRRGPQSFRVLLGPSHVDVVARKLNDGGLIIQVRCLAACIRVCENAARRLPCRDTLCPGWPWQRTRLLASSACAAAQVDGQSHVIHSEEEAVGTRLTIDSLTCLLAAEMDPSRLVALSPGKLMRYLVPEGSHVVPDQAYAEVEARHTTASPTASVAGSLCGVMPWFGGCLPSAGLVRLQVMKMLMPLLTPAAGVITFQVCLEEASRAVCCRRGMCCDML